MQQTVAQVQSIDPFLSEKYQRQLERRTKRTQRNAIKKQKAEQAAEILGTTGPEDLDTNVLLGDLIGDSSIKWLVFILPSGSEVVVSRMKLVKLKQITKRSKRFEGLRAWVDTRGLQIRWGAPGGLCFRGRPLDRFESRTLAVVFAQEQDTQRFPEQSGIWPIAGIQVGVNCDVR